MPNAPKKHKRPWAKVYKPHQRSINMDWFYQSYAWRKFSKAYKERHPLCIDCEAEGIVSPSEVTDHKVRYLDDGPGFDLENLKDEYFEPRCNKHHNSRSGRQSGSNKRGMG